jgi:transposase InsO family protein
VLHEATWQRCRVHFMRNLLFKVPVRPTRASARSAIFEYIEGWYNRSCRHSSLGYLSPADYERRRERLDVTIDEAA